MQKKEEKEKSSFCLSKKTKERLLKLARESIETAFSSSLPKLESYKDISIKAGAFVTLSKNKSLRGCIGYPLPAYELYAAIFKAARAAAFEDPRFPPLKRDELNEIAIEISVLSEPEPLKYKDREELVRKIAIGKDGLILESPFGSGLLLPQVALEHNMSAEEFLDSLCLKAGLGKGCWKDSLTKLYSFNALVFSEKS